MRLHRIRTCKSSHYCYNLFGYPTKNREHSETLRDGFWATYANCPKQLKERRRGTEREHRKSCRLSEFEKETFLSMGIGNYRYGIAVKPPVTAEQLRSTKCIFKSLCERHCGSLCSLVTQSLKQNNYLFVFSSSEKESCKRKIVYKIMFEM